MKLFERVIDEFGGPVKDTSALVVTHLLPNAPPFVNALAKAFDVPIVFPKARSVHLPTKRELENNNYRVSPIDRAQMEGLVWYNDVMRNVPATNDVLLLDIGGYFSTCLPELGERLGGRLIGVIEDTENGHQKYADIASLPCPVFSAARSPLKDPEDFLVGQAIVYSTENVLREQNVLLINKTCVVIGYGKIGRSIAATLASRNIDVRVSDHNPIRQAQARSHGFHSGDWSDLLQSADVVFSATGNGALCVYDFMLLRDGCFVASVTSADDEFDLTGCGRSFIVEKDTSGHSTYRKREDSDRYFYMLHDGEAINFKHNAVLGPYIYLVQSELIAAALLCAHKGISPTHAIAEIAEDDRRKIATLWNETFAEQL